MNNDNSKIKNNNSDTVKSLGPLTSQNVISYFYHLYG